MISELTYRGGSCASDLTVSESETYQLLPTQRWQRIQFDGGAGTCIIRTCGVLHRVPGGPYWSLLLNASTDDPDIVFHDIAGNVLSIYDKNGAVKTSIDVSDTDAWGDMPAVVIYLDDSSTDAGTWTIMYWHEGQPVAAIGGDQEIELPAIEPTTTMGALTLALGAEGAIELASIASTAAMGSLTVALGTEGEITLASIASTATLGALTVANVIPGGSIDFESSSSEEIRYSTGTDLANMTALTVGIFVKAESLNTFPFAISNWGPAGNGWVLYRNSTDGRIEASVEYDDTGSTDTGVTTSDITTAAWYFIGFTWTTTGMVVFSGPVAGTIEAASTAHGATRTTIGDGPGTMVIGGYDGSGDFWDGLLAHAFIIPNHAASSADMQAVGAGTLHPADISPAQARFYASLNGTSNADDEADMGWTGSLINTPTSSSDYPPIDPPD